MKLYFALVLVLLVVATFAPSEAMPQRRFQGRLRGFRARNALPRSGRQGDEVAPPPAGADDEAAEDGDDIPEWCNPEKPMGAWMNFGKIRTWCADNGYTNFGPYGGVPTEGEEEVETTE